MKADDLLTNFFCNHGIHQFLYATVYFTGPDYPYPGRINRKNIASFRLNFSWTTLMIKVDVYLHAVACQHESIS